MRNLHIKKFLKNRDFEKFVVNIFLIEESCDLQNSHTQSELSSIMHKRVSMRNDEAIEYVFQAKHNSKHKHIFHYIFLQ